jgi:sugar lactone lactonase YvrE
MGCLLAVLVAAVMPSVLPAQDDAETGEDQSVKSVEVPEPVATESAVVTYPRAVAVDGEQLLIVDLDLPGVWRGNDGAFSVYTPGTKLLKKPMNRPWSIAPHPAGGILVGDSASREIYHVAQPGTQLTALNGGYLGIPMALAVDAAGETIYVGDAERRAVFRLPISGGQPELVVRVNARGLSFDAEGNLWAVTPDAEAVQRIDVEANTAETIVGDRPYQFPNGIVWAGEEGFVTDGYGKSIWRFTADGKTEKWFEGEPLVNPVGIAADEQSLYVADPHAKQVFRISRGDKTITPLQR